MVRYNNNRAVGTIGGGYLEKLQIVVILAYLLYIYVNSDILIHLPMNSGSVECTSWDFFLHLF